MRTDSLFYRIFSSAPQVLFQLIGQPAVPGYRFQSVELKETAFRIDGVFLPPSEAAEAPVFFIEVQFQPDPGLYQRLFAEIFLFLRQNPSVTDWQALVLFPQRGLEPEQTRQYRTLLASPQVQLYFLDELRDRSDLPVGLGVLQLVVEPAQTTPGRARQLLRQAQEQLTEPLTTAIIELIETTLVYKFPQMSRQEIEAMLGLVDDVKQTRVYQEGRQEGREEGKEQEGRSLVLRQLNRRLGTLSSELVAQVEGLPLAKLEALAEALLDFASEADLRDWLAANC